MNRLAGGALLLIALFAAWRWTRDGPNAETGRVKGLAQTEPATASSAAGTSSARAGSAAEPGSAAGAYSNVRPEDYVGPEMCGGCHDERYQQWQGNLHRRMNRLVTEPGAVLGDFSNASVEYAGGVARFERVGDGYFMTFERAGAVYRRYRLTRTIGARYMQEYVGVQVKGPEAAGHESYSTEIRLPFGFLISQERWVHQQYFDSWHDAEYDANGAMSNAVFDPEQSPWRGRCAWCHNTYSFDKRLARLQGATQVGSGIELLYVDHQSDPKAFDGDNLLPVEDLVSVGISCESCHFGGREHAVNGKPIRFEPSGVGVEKNSQAPVVAGTRSDARTINAICAQCHSTPTELFPNGAGTRNSSEALDLLSGACASRIKCTDCHDPHVPGPGALAADQPKHLAACTGCHQNLADSAIAAQHSKHESTVTCLDCHMPRMVQGVDELLRSHRISSPADEEMLVTSLNACNLCHLDRSIAWTKEHLVADHGLAIDVAVDDKQPAARLWLSSDTRILRLTAASALGYSPLGPRFVADLVERLDDPVAYDRLRYLWALEDILGRELGPSEYDVTAEPTTRAAQWRALKVALPQKKSASGL